MPTVYIAGDAPGVGVTAAATGLASLLEDATLAKAASFHSPDPDAAFHRVLQPDTVNPPGWPLALAAGGDATRTASEAANAPSNGSLVIVEGVSGAATTEERLRADAALAEALDARVLLVTSCASADPSRASAAFGQRLMGALINRAPVHGLRSVQMETAHAFQERAIPVLGLVPEDRRMLAPTVRDVAERLGAECINRDALEDADVALDALVEHFMLGGLFLDTGVYVFGRRERKAVIVRGDRPDLQMAALDTSTVCLVLTEGRLPVQYIVHHAALNQVPMLLVNQPTLETMEALHTIGERVTAHSVAKARRFGEMLLAHCDLAPFTQTALT